MTCGEMPAQNGSDLEVDEVGRGQVLTAKALTSQVAVAAVVGQRHYEHAGINDEHVRTARW